MSTDDKTVQQRAPDDLEPVADLTPRRRRELAREMEDKLADRGVRVLSELVKRPTDCWLVNGYRHSRGRNSHRHSVVSQLYRLLLDRAASLDQQEAADRLLLLLSEVDAVVTQLLDRVVGLGESEVDLQTALSLESEADANQDVVEMEALADELVSREDAERIEEATNSEIARKRMLIRAINRARTSGELPSEGAA